MWYLSVILIHLPGNDIIYGAYEVLHGSTINGAARVTGAVLRAMAMAVCITLGWQISGRQAVPVDPLRNATMNGAQASFVPVSSCKRTPGHEEISWQLAFGGYIVMLTINICIAFNMRLRRMTGPLLVAWSSLFVYGYLSFGLTGDDTISSYVVNVVILFMAGTLSIIWELFNGCPYSISIIPVVLILAPGSGAVKISLTDMQEDGGVTQMGSSLLGIWDELVLTAVSYAVGLYVVFEVMKIPLSMKRQLRAKADQLRESFSIA